MRIRVWLTVGAVTVLGAGCEDGALVGVGGGRVVDEDRWTVAVARGDRLELFGVNGNIHVTPTDGNDVEIVVTKSGDARDVSRVKIEQLEHFGGVTICAIYPSPPGKVNECRVGGASQDVHDVDASVHFDVRVPPGVDLVAHTVNGRVEALDLDGDVDAATVNGAIEVSTSGVAEASSVNGRVEARLGRSDWSGRLEFSTVNGAIEVWLPPDASTHVFASTVNGSIHSDFAMVIRDPLVGRQASGTLGSGGRDLRLSTVNGSLALRSN